MAEAYTKKNGHLVNSRGEWVWNGESYEYVISHSDWLPLVFKSKADSDAFELLEKIWKAEQIVKNSHNQQEVTLAKEWLRNHGIKHSDMNETIYLAHYEAGKMISNHKYIRREPLRNGKYRYIYNDSRSMVKGSSDSAGNGTSSQEKSEEYRNGRYFYNYNEKTGKISMDRDAKKRLRELKRDARKAKREVQTLQKDKSLHDPKTYIINGENYYKTKDGHLVRAGKYGEYVRSQEQEANSKSAKAYANYSRQLRLAEKEKEELKKYRAECQKAARKEFSDALADKGMSIINKLFKRS